MKLLKYFIAFLFVQNMFSQQFEQHITFTNSSPNDLDIKNGVTYVTSAQTIAKRINDNWVIITPEAFPNLGNFETSYRIHVISENKIYASSIESGVNSKFKIWNGTNWTNIGTLPNDARRITDIEYVSDNEIYIGIFKFSPNKAKVYKFNGTDWSDLNFPDLNDVNIQITYANPTEIYASILNNIYLYDGSSWSNIDTNSSIVDRPYISYVDENNKYLSGKPQLVNFANNTIEEVGDIYTSAAEKRGHIDRVIAFSNNDIYVSVSREFGSLNAKAFFVSHWNGNEWNRIWTFNSSNSTDDYLTFFLQDENFIYAKIINRDLYKFNRNTLNIDEVDLINKTKIYPNPVADFIEIKTPYTSVELFNSLGQKIELKQVSETKFESPKKNGIYLLKISNGKKVFTQRIIRE